MGVKYHGYWVRGGRKETFWFVLVIFHLICGLGIAFIQLTNAKVAILCDNGEIKQVTRHFRFSSLPRGLKDHWALKLNSSGRQ